MTLADDTGVTLTMDLKGLLCPLPVVKLSKAKTVQGSEAKIRVKDGKVYVDNALVTATDIKAGNGVIHVIDSVILPN